MRQNTSRRGLSLLLAVVMSLALVVSPGFTASAATEDTEGVVGLNFDIVTEVREYGSVVSAVVVDMKTPVCGADIELDTFSVSAVTKDANGTLVYDGSRTVINAYASDSNVPGTPVATGNYVVLELKEGYSQDFARINGSGAARYGMYFDMDYAVKMDKAIAGVDSASITQRDQINLIVDDFALVSNPVEGFTAHQYRMYTPAEAAAGKPLPLVIFHHGMGENYTDAGVSGEGKQLVANMGGTGWVLNAPEPCYVLAPQRGFAGNTSSPQDGVIAFVRDLIAKGKVDANRVYISGASQGGQQVYNYMRAAPDLFAAALPICPLGSSSISAAVAETIKHIPTWFVYATNDPISFMTNPTAAYNNFRAVGAADARLTAFPNVFGNEIPSEEFDFTSYQGPDNGNPTGHFSWIMVLNNEFVADGGIPDATEGASFMDWLFKQKKPVAITEGATVTADPDSPTGYTVTFVYKNENATGVRLAGDLTLLDVNEAGSTRYQPEQWQTGRYHMGGTEFTRAMTKDENGYWSVSIPMHAGGLSYWYRVDDPTQGWSNKRIWDPAASHPRPDSISNPTAWRTVNNDVLGAVYVPYSEKQNDPILESRAAYELPRENSAERGTVQYVPYTNVLGGNGHLGVYLPPNYDPDRAEPYPVVYLSHGSGGDETDWMVPGNAPNILDNVIAKGEIEPTVLVTIGNQFTPSGTRMTFDDRNAINNQIQCVMPFIEANFNVSDKREGRAYGGFSQGSAIAEYMLREHHEKFGYIGYLGFGSSAGSRLGTFDYTTLEGPLPTLLLTCGTKDSNLTSASALPYGKQRLDASGVEYFEYTHPGAHDMMSAGMGFTVFARDYLWEEKTQYAEGPTVVEDPDSPTGYSVTFVYYNPRATAVRLAGDLTLAQNYVTGTAGRRQPEEWESGWYHAGGTEFLRNMVSDGNGYWSVTLPLHAGGLSYWYRVDGDPELSTLTNARIWDPTAAHPRPETDVGGGYTPWRSGRNDVLDAVYVPYDSEKQNDADLKSRATYELPMSEASERGTVRYIPYTTSTGVTSALGVYLPPGYDENREKPYPVMYAHHGNNGDETDYMIPGNVPNIIDNMIARGELEPTIVVTMSSMPITGGTAPNNNRAQNLVNVILPLIEANYNASKVPGGRAVGGFSMGSSDTYNVLRAYPNVFGYYALFCGSTVTAAVAGEIAAAAETAGVDAPFVFMGRGTCEGPLTNWITSKRNCVAVGIPAAAHYAVGAHDMTTVGRLFTTFAKNYLWKETMVEGPTVKADPDSPTGYTVEFVYYNPNASAVRLAGDLTLAENYVTGIAGRRQPEDWAQGWYHAGGTEFLRDMVNNGNGYWSVSLPLHAGGLSYWYRVDGDPSVYTGTAQTVPAAGARIWDPVSAHPRPEVLYPGYQANRTRANDVLDTVYVPYDPIKQSDPDLEGRATYELPRSNTAERGTVTYIPYTTYTGGTSYLGVYLPPGYDANRAEPYPVMYACHGGGGDETDYMICGNTPNILDNLLARGETEPTILVTMAYTVVTGTTDGISNQARNIVETILPLIESRYNASNEPDGRAIGGFSAGSSMSLTVLRAFPTSFGYIGLFCGGSVSAADTTTISAAAKAAGVDTPFVFMGRGTNEGPLTSLITSKRNCVAAGIPAVAHHAVGAHDMTTVGRLFTTFAKNYLWKETMVEGPTVKADPDSPTGYTVEFVYYNPNATAVRLAGDLWLASVGNSASVALRRQPEDWEQGWYHMGGFEWTRDMINNGNGYWSISIPMHAGGLSYWYRVIGDPSVYTGTAQTVPAAGARIWDPVSAHPRPEVLYPGYKANRTRANDVLDTVYVPYDPVKQNDPDLEGRAIYELPRSNAAERGTVTYIPYTTYTGGTSYLGVYLPPGYDANCTEPYPVVYACHGGGGDETDFMICGNTPNITDNLIARGEMDPTILVTMAYTVVSGTTDGISNQVRNIVETILPLIENQYNASNTREGRAIGGFSAGGTMTKNVYKAFPGTFGYVGIFAGMNAGPNEAEAADIKAASGDNSPFIFMARGDCDLTMTDMYASLSYCEAVGIQAAVHPVVGAHDMTSVGRMFTIFGREYLWKMEDDPKVDATVTSVVSTIVAEYAANLPAEVVFNGDPVSFELGLYDPNGKLLNTIDVSANGKYTFKLDASDAVAGTYTIKAVGAADGASVNCVAQPTDLWVPKVTIADENTVVVTFAADVTFNTSKKGVRIDGVPVSNSNVSVSGGVVTITGVTAAQGQQLVIAGVKYAELFPSYSFTFTLLIP